MLSSSEKEIILKYCDKRWKMFVKSSLGRLCLYFQPFLGVQETTQDFLKELSIENCSNWAQNILPPAIAETAIADCVILGQPLMPNNYPVHQTLANLIKKFPVSEASVERAFSRHKLVHSRLRASLGVEKLDETLFIRYNFEVILKASEKDKKPIELEKEIENWSSVYIDDLVEIDDES